MIENNYPFGQTIIKNFKKGDLVYWNEWKVIKKVLNKTTKFGVYVDKVIKFVGNREVVYAVVMPADAGDIIEILALRLKKEQTN